MANPLESIDYLSPEWIAAADASVAGLTPLDDTVVVGFMVTDTEHQHEYRVDLGPGIVGVRPGVDGSNVTIRLSRTLAIAIANGETSAQRAFLDGVLTIGGDINVLIANAAAMAAVDDRLGSLRARTIF